jgi:hypothetical protein
MSTPDPVPPGAGMPAPVTAGAMPWFTSNDQWVKIKAGVAVVALAFPKAWFITRYGLGDPVKVSAYTNAAIAVWPAWVLTVGFVKRSRSTLQPLVNSWRAAREHKATIALAQVQAEMARKGVDLAVARQAQLQTSADAAPIVPAPAPPPPILVTHMSPELVHTIAVAMVAELAHQQAAYRAAHLVPSSAATPAPPIAQSPLEK